MESHAFWTAPGRRQSAGKAKIAMHGGFYYRQLWHAKRGLLGLAISDGALIAPKTARLSAPSGSCRSATPPGVRQVTETKLTKTAFRSSDRSGRGPSVGRQAGFSCNRTFGRRLRRDDDGQVMAESCP